MAKKEKTTTADARTAVQKRIQKKRRILEKDTFYKISKAITLMAVEEGEEADNFLAYVKSQKNRHSVTSY